MNIPDWALSISYWLHMIATITWFGGIGIYSIIAVPIFEKQLNTKDFATLLQKVNKKLDPIGWFSLAILTFTGLFQMSGNTNYQGLLNIESDWAQAILIKHIFFFTVIGLSSFYTWNISPKLEREIFKLSQNVNAPGFQQLYQNSIRIKNWSLICGLLILLFTALSRVS